MYSFTTPKPKPLIKEDTKLWLIFIGISVILYISFAIFLEIKTILYNKDIETFNKEIITLKRNITDIISQKEFIYKQKTLYDEIMFKNSLIK